MKKYRATVSYHFFNDKDGDAKREFEENYMSTKARRLNKFIENGFEMPQNTRFYITENSKNRWREDFSLTDNEIENLPNTKVKTIHCKSDNQESNGLKF